jgi:hypothetical protein
VEWNATTIHVAFCYKRITICLHVLLLGFLSDARNSTPPLCFPFSLSVHFIAISNRELSPAHEASVGSLHIQFIEAAFGLLYETVTNFRSFIFIIAVDRSYSHCNGLRNGGLWMKVLWKIGVEVIAALLKKQWHYESYLLVYFHSGYGEWNFEVFGGMFM